MRKKLKEGKYKNWEDFERDFELIVKNCTTFNPPGSVWYKAALRLRKDSKKIIEDLKDQTEVELPPPPPEPVKPPPAAPSTEERKKRRYVKSGLYKKRQDTGIESSGGLLINDLGMGSTATPYDLLTIWNREQSLQEAGCRPFTQRAGNSLRDTQVGPMYYLEYRPFRDRTFVTQYENRVEHFVKGASPMMLKRARRKINIAQGMLPDNHKSYWTPPEELLKDVVKVCQSVREAKTSADGSGDSKTTGGNPGSIQVFGVPSSELEKLKEIGAGNVLQKMVQAAQNIAEIRRREEEAKAAKAKAKAKAEALAQAQAAEAARQAAANQKKQQELQRQQAAQQAAAQQAAAAHAQAARQQQMQVQGHAQAMYLQQQQRQQQQQLHLQRMAQGQIPANINLLNGRTQDKNPSLQTHQQHLAAQQAAQAQAQAHAQAQRQRLMQLHQMQQAQIQLRMQQQRAQHQNVLKYFPNALFICTCVSSQR